jgi:hypothetical protein
MRASPDFSARAASRWAASVAPISTMFSAKAGAVRGGNQMASAA